MADKRIDNFLVQSVIPATTKGGKPYLRLKLFEKGGKAWPGIFWESRELKPGTVINASVEESEFGGEAQLTVHAMREVKVEGAIEDFFPKTPHSIDGMMKGLEAYLEEIGDGKLRALVAKALADPRWRRAPAATALHHAYLGGLLEHTLELCRLADAVARLYPRVRRGLLLTGAILHDLGKMDEMDCGITMEYTVDGLLVGHIVLAMIRVSRWMDELGFDEERRREVLHLIASHHGQKAYGSPKEPLMLEAQLLCDIDGISAHAASIGAALDKTPADRLWSDKVKYETRYYAGSFKPEA